MVTLRQLQHALALKRHGNFHRAAESENISQSAFSRSIRALEEELGVVLFDRKGGEGVAPTLFGEALLERADRVFGETDELMREIQLIKGLDEGSLKIAAGVYAAGLSVGRAVGRLAARHPNIRCRVEIAEWTRVPRLVLERKVDLGIGETSTLEQSAEFQITPLGAHPAVFFCRRSHPLIGHEPVDKDLLDQYPVVTVRLPPRVAAEFPGMGTYDPETGERVPSIQVDDFVTARQVVMNSDAFGVATVVQLAPWLRSGQLRILPFSRPWMKLHYGLIHLRSRMVSPAAMLYIELIKQVEEEVALEIRALMDEFRGLAKEQRAS